MLFLIAKSTKMPHFSSAKGVQSHLYNWSCIISFYCWCLLHAYSCLTKWASFLFINFFSCRDSHKVLLVLYKNDVNQFFNYAFCGNCEFSFICLVSCKFWRKCRHTNLQYGRVHRQKLCESFQVKQGMRLLVKNKLVAS